MLHRYSLSSRSPQYFYYSARNRYWYFRCHASRAQLLRHLPMMLLYDLAQATWKRQLGTYARALKDGFGALPESLRGQPRSNRPDYVARIDKVAADVSVWKIFRNAAARMRGITPTGRRTALVREREPSGSAAGVEP
jgi:hypothetical protein